MKCFGDIGDNGFGFLFLKLIKLILVEFCIFDVFFFRIFGVVCVVELVFFRSKLLRFVFVFFFVLDLGKLVLLFWLFELVMIC